MSRKRERRITRLRGYDYTQPGGYFVTICTEQRVCIFGEIADGVMQLSAQGEIVAECWESIPAHFPHVVLDVWVVMPNHVHGIIIIEGDPVRESTGQTSGEGFSRPVAKSLSTIVRSYKSAVTRRINQEFDLPGMKVWQGRYYDHVIRNDADLQRIREYIVSNPTNWAEDKDNPQNW